jgi:hypothetical protein
MMQLRFQNGEIKSQLKNKRKITITRSYEGRTTIALLCRAISDHCLDREIDVLKKHFLFINDIYIGLLINKCVMHLRLISFTQNSGSISIGGSNNTDNLKHIFSYK